MAGDACAGIIAVRPALLTALLVVLCGTGASMIATGRDHRGPETQTGDAHAETRGDRGESDSCPLAPRVRISTFNLALRPFDFLLPCAPSCQSPTSCLSRCLVSQRPQPYPSRGPRDAHHCDRLLVTLCVLADNLCSPLPPGSHSRTSKGPLELISLPGRTILL